MNLSVKKIPNEIFFEQVMEEINSGESVRIRVTGRSMMPTFRDRKDEIVLSPFNKEELKVGDVVLFNRGDTICVHRIIARKGDKLIIRGDGNAHKAYEPCTVDDVMAIVTGGTMYGGKPFTVQDKKWKANTSMVLKHHSKFAVWHRISAVLRRYPLSILVLAVLLYLSFFKPLHPILPDVDNSDKILHFLMYLGVGLTFWTEWLKGHSFAFGSMLRGSIFCLFFPVVLGGLIELGQEYITEYRSGDVWDFVSNVAGSLVATILAAALIIPLGRFILKRRK